MTAARRAVLAGLLAGALGGCRRREPPLAVLLEARGVVERTASTGWTPARAGSGFAIGDALRTGPASSARLRVEGGSVVRVGENARLRFGRGAQPGSVPPELAIELGVAEIESAGELSLRTPAGPARVERGGRLRVRSDTDTVTFELLVGRAVVGERDGDVALEPGRSVAIHIGGAVVERFDLAVGAAIVERAPAAPAASAAPTEEPAATSENGDADLTVIAGESAVVHDSRSLLRVRLRFDELCPDGGAVEIAGAARRAQRLTGARAVVARLGPVRPTDRYRYRLRCADQPADAAPRATGVLALERDTGDAPLSRRPPTNTLDADGRRYTVLFQTRLPALTLGWGAAPDGGAPLELHVVSGARERVLRAVGARTPLPSGALGEGTHTWWYAAAGSGGARSPKTTVTVRFDNAAPVAQFFRESAPAATPGAIAIDGVTVQGAKVSAGGKNVEVDGAGRFRAAMAPEAGDHALAVRLELPRSGVHYYVRRAVVSRR